MHTAAATAVAAAALLSAGCGMPDSKSGVATPPDMSSVPDRNNPNPETEVTGTCDYSLSDTSGGQNFFTGEAGVKNTGNIGLKVRVTATWPQYGFDPLSVKKTISVDYKQTVTMRFRRPASPTQTLRYQSWQERHEYKSGCTYKGKILSTYGGVR
jgi:hypothetical protein